MLTAKHRSEFTSSTTSVGILRYVPSLYQVTLIAILGAILIVALAPRLDTDFWWHLKDGAYIWSNHVVPSHDFMSYTMVGHAWTDHEWLAELGLYGLYSVMGLWGPIAFFAVIICATFGMVYLQMQQRGVPHVLALFVVAAAYIASSASWGPRIQMLTLFFLAAYTLVLSRFDVTRDRRLFVVFPLLMVLWANVHGGFVLGLVVIAVTLFGEWLNGVTKLEGAWSREDLRALAIALGGTVAVTMLNPNGVRQLLYPLTFVLPNPYTNLIEESASPNFHMPVMMVFEAMLLSFIVAIFVARPRINWTHLFMTVAFTHLAFSQVRNVAIWAVVVSPLVALYLQRTGPALRELFPRATYRRRPVRSTLATSMNGVLLLLVLGAYLLEGTHFVNATSLRQAETDNYPRGAIAYMHTHRLPQHVFVSYAWGGYLLWNLFPAYRDYMDSRADTLYTARILNNYLTAYDAGPGWDRVLKRYTVGTVLIESSAPLAQVLARAPGWHLAYRDNLSVIYQHG